MKVNDEAAYLKWRENNTRDSYSAGVVSYLERWADMMEREIAAGKSLSDVAESTSRLADTEGITAFMYGGAVGALSHFWVHGEALRQWNLTHHN